nr:MAG TPA: RNA polymerase I-like protein [Caudoviricetes sp.]
MVYAKIHRRCEGCKMRKRKKIDKITGKIKCPKWSCRSANVQIIGHGLFSTKYQCKECGRVFKG